MNLVKIVKYKSIKKLKLTRLPFQIRIDLIPFVNERNPPLGIYQHSQSADLLQLVFLTIKYEMVFANCSYYANAYLFIHEDYAGLVHEKFKHKAHNLLDTFRETHSRIIQRYAQATCFSSKIQAKINHILNYSQFRLQDIIQ
jgi:hypothetical protein